MLKKIAITKGGSRLKEISIFEMYTLDDLVPKPLYLDIASWYHSNVMIIVTSNYRTHKFELILQMFLKKTIIKSKLNAIVKQYECSLSNRKKMDRQSSYSFHIQA